MLQSFLSTALPIVIAALFGTWANNKRLDCLGRSGDFTGRLDDIALRLDRIENLLDGIHDEIARRGEGITRLELAHR